MVAINEMLSPEVQADRYDQLKVIPVLDNTKLSDDQKAEFDKVDLGKGTIPQDELLSKRLPEMPAQLVPIIEEIWNEEVVGNNFMKKKVVTIFITGSSDCTDHYILIG